MKCKYGRGCEEEGVVLAIGRPHYKESNDLDYEEVPGSPVGLYCKTHARLVSDEGNPEYVVDCPNCKCRFGVN